MSESGSAKHYTPNIGEAAKPPPVVLPYPPSLFLNRSKRFLSLAPGHQLESYLRFLAAVTRAQHDVQVSLPEAAPPSAETVAQAVAHGMPLIPRCMPSACATRWAAVCQASHPMPAEGLSNG